MTKVNKEDFDIYLGSAPYYTKKDKERFYENLHRKKKKQWFPQALTTALIVSLLFIGAQFLQEEFSFFGGESNSTSTIQIGETEYHLASTKKGVYAYFEKITPGLALAEEIGLVTKPNKTIKLKDGSDLRIEKIWYTSDEVQIFYSIEIPDIENLKEEGILPFIDKITLEKDHEGRFNKQLLTMGQMGQPIIRPYNTIVYGDRIYYKLDAYTILSEEQIIEFEDDVTVDISVDWFGDKLEIEDINVPIFYSHEKETALFVKQEIHQTIKNDHFTLTYDWIESRVTHNLLYGTLQTPEDIIVYSLNGYVEQGSGLDPIHFASKVSPDNNGWITQQIEPFRTIPEELTVHIEDVNLISNDSVEFSYDVLNLLKQVDEIDASGYEEHHKGKIADVKDTEVFLESVSYNFNNVEGLKFTILFKPKKEGQNIKLLATDTPLFVNLYDGGIKLPFAFTAFNEKGEPAEIISVGGPNRTEKGTSVSFVIGNDFVQNSSTIEIKIENLVYNVRVDESITFPIKNN